MRIWNEVCGDELLQTVDKQYSDIISVRYSTESLAFKDNEIVKDITGETVLDIKPCPERLMRNASKLYKKNIYWGGRMNEMPHNETPQSKKAPDHWYEIPLKTAINKEIFYEDAKFTQKTVYN
eukprot:UN02004